MPILSIKVVLEQEGEADIVADAAISSLEKGEAALTLNWRFVGSKTKRPIPAKAASGRIVVAKDGKTVTNGDNNPINALPPKDSDKRLVDVLLLCQEWIQSARDCGEIPEYITIGVGG